MRYPDRLKPALPEPYRILPELMRDLGYVTGNVGQVGPVRLNRKDDWLFQTQQNSWDTHELSNLKAQSPFFAMVQFSNAHRRFNPAKPFINPDDVKVPEYYPDHQVSRQDWADYLGAVNRVDQQVGQVMKELERQHLLENSIVVFLSDHGRPMIRGKNWLYDSGTRIPMVVRMPDAEAPRSADQVREQLLSSVDLVAQTIVWAGGKPPQWMQGREFMGKDVKQREYVFSAVDRIGDIETLSRAARSQRFKYIRNFKTPGSINGCSTAYRKANHPIYHLIELMDEQKLLSPVQRQLVAAMPQEEFYDLVNDPMEDKEPSRI